MAITTRHEIITRLATGGMAEVALARERGLGGMERLVVLKRILPHLAEDPDFVQMFLREGRLIARLNHPHIVQIFEIGADAGRYFLSLEYIHGVTLRELQVHAARAGQALSPMLAVEIAIQSCRALHAAHELRDLDGSLLGLVHRDVTPHNIMCTPEGAIKLLDFGIAKATQHHGESTWSGDLKGKFGYMSPEQCRQQPLDRRSDLFSAGIVLWELLTDRRLFKRPSDLEIMQAVTTGEVPAPSLYNPQVPPSLDALALRALSRQREDRPDSAATLQRELELVSHQEGWGGAQERLSAFVQASCAGLLQARAPATLLTQVAAPEGEESPTRITPITASSSYSYSAAAAPPPPADASFLVVNARPEEEEEAAAEAPTRVMPSGPHDTLSAQAAHAEVNTAPDGAAQAASEVPAQERASARKPRASARVMSRRLVMLSVGLMAALLIPALVRPDRKPLRMGWAPTADEALILREIEPLRRYLEDELKRPIEFKVSADYDGLTRQLDADELDAAVLPPMLYLRTRAQLPTVKALAIKQYDGATMSDGVLLVSSRHPPDRGLGALRGATFCLTDRSSTSGHALPRAWLKAQGHEPDVFIGQVHWSGDHIQALKDLIDGRCEAAASYSGAVLSADRLGVAVSTLRTLAITGHIPQDMVVARQALPQAERDALQRALLAFKPERDVKAPRLGDTQRITGFSTPDAVSYEALERLVRDDLRDQ